MPKVISVSEETHNRLVLYKYKNKIRNFDLTIQKLLEK